MKDKEKKLLLHNVIGGLEEKEVKEIMALFVKTHCEGHNQLCNREVECKLDVIDDFYSYAPKYRTKEELKRVLYDAISQGKVMKITKEE